MDVTNLEIFILILFIRFPNTMSIIYLFLQIRINILWYTLYTMCTPCWISDLLGSVSIT